MSWNYRVNSQYYLKDTVDENVSDLDKLSLLQAITAKICSSNITKEDASGVIFYDESIKQQLPLNEEYNEWEYKYFNLEDTSGVDEKLYGDTIDFLNGLEPDQAQYSQINLTQGSGNKTIIIYYPFKNQ